MGKMKGANESECYRNKSKPNRISQPYNSTRSQQQESDIIFRLYHLKKGKQSPVLLSQGINNVSKTHSREMGKARK